MSADKRLKGWPEILHLGQLAFSASLNKLASIVSLGPTALAERVMQHQTCVIGLRPHAASART